MVSPWYAEKKKSLKTSHSRQVLMGEVFAIEDRLFYVVLEKLIQAQGP